MSITSINDELPEVLTAAFGEQLLHAAITGSHVMGFDNCHSDIDVIAICKNKTDTTPERYQALRCQGQTVEVWVLTPDAVERIAQEAVRDTPSVDIIRRAGKIAHGQPIVRTTASAALTWDAGRIAAMRLPAHRRFKIIALNEYWDLSGAWQAGDVSYAVEATNRLIGSELNALLALLGDLSAKRKRFAARLRRAKPECVVLAQAYDRHITLTEGLPPPRVETRLTHAFGVLAHVQCLSAALGLGLDLPTAAWARPDGLPVTGPICLFATDQAHFAFSDAGKVSVEAPILAALLTAILAPGTDTDPKPAVQQLADHLGLALPGRDLSFLEAAL